MESVLFHFMQPVYSITFSCTCSMVHLTKDVHKDSIQHFIERPVYPTHVCQEGIGEEYVEQDRQMKQSRNLRYLSLTRTETKCA